MHLQTYRSLLLSIKICLSSKVIYDASPDSPPACMGWKTSAKIMLNPACEGWSSSIPRMAVPMVPYQLRDGPSDCHHRWPPEWFARKKCAKHRSIRAKDGRCLEVEEVGSRLLIKVLANSSTGFWPILPSM